MLRCRGASISHRRQPGRGKQRSADAALIAGPGAAAAAVACGITPSHSVCQRSLGLGVRAVHAAGGQGQRHSGWQRRQRSDRQRDWSPGMNDFAPRLVLCHKAVRPPPSGLRVAKEVEAKAHCIYTGEGCQRLFSADGKVHGLGRRQARPGDAAATERSSRCSSSTCSSWRCGRSTCSRSSGRSPSWRTATSCCWPWSRTPTR